MSRLTWDGTAEPVSRDQVLRPERGQGNIPFSYSVDHVQDWQPYPVDLYSCYMCDYTRGRRYILGMYIKYTQTRTYTQCLLRGLGRGRLIRD